MALLVMGAGFGLVSSQSRAQSILISINNASFENPVTTSFTSSGMPGWSFSGNEYAGVWNPSTYPLAVLTAPVGVQVGFINGQGSISQTLSATLQANSTYSLRIEIGGRADVWTPGTNYSVSLYAGASLLTSVTPVVPPTSSWTTLNATYTSGATVTPNQSLKIVISASADSWQFDFDNVLLAFYTTPSSSLVVTNLQPDSSGVNVFFNRAIKASVLTLYGSNVPVDFTMIGSNSGPVTGSLIIGAQAASMTFIKTGGPLLADAYTVTLVSATNGFQDLYGNLLDGNGDGIPGDNYVAQFAVTPSTNRVLSLPDFARAPGQFVNIPETNSGIPVTISDGSSVQSISLSIQYNTNLLQITGASLGSALPAGWTLMNISDSPGILQLSLGGSVPLSPGTNTIATLAALVPWCASYGSSEVLSISSVQINGGAIPSTGDSAVEVAALLGDVDGNGFYTTNDADTILQFSVHQFTGFAAYPLVDPVIIGDLSGDSDVTPYDASLVAQYVAGTSVPFIPALPAPSLSIIMVTNQALISWPECADGYILQQSTTLGPQANWTAVTNSPVLIGGQQTIFVTPAGTQQFYRLFQVATPSEMAFIPAGSFTMGDSLDGDTNAVPVSVTVSAFYIDENLVSYNEWQIVYNWATNNGYSFVNAGSGKASNHPVQTLDWYDAVKWCNARSQQQGLTPVYCTNVGFTQVYTTGETDAVYPNWAANGYRLPTEAEWEKAARGELIGLRFPWGNTISGSQANYFGCVACYSYDLGPDGYNSIGSIGGLSPPTSPVGSFPANSYGLYDMAGNVYEWCWDWYGTPYGKPTTTNPTGPSSGSGHVLRGGSWNDNANRSRCADRGDGGPPSDHNSRIGFRCVRGY